MRRSATASSARRLRSSISRSPSGHVTVRGRALAWTCGMSNRPATAPGTRLHCKASQAEPNAASFPGSSSPCQCDDADVSVGTIRSCAAGSKFPDRLRSGSDMRCLQPGLQLRRRHTTREFRSDVLPLCPAHQVAMLNGVARSVGPGSQRRNVQQVVIPCCRSDVSSLPDLSFLGSAFWPQIVFRAWRGWH
jgi:hypothetical protein